jgi:GxxExxY protein
MMGTMEIPREVNRISGEIVDAAYKVHSKLGPGLLESVYEVCLTHGLSSRGLHVQRQVQLPVVYDGITLHCASTCLSKTSWSLN